MVKRIYSIHLLCFIIIFLVGCSTQNTQLSQDYDFAIIDNKNVTTFQEEKNGLNKIGSQKWTDDHLGLWRDTFWKLNDCYYTKTTTNSKMETFLAKVNQDLTIDLVQDEGSDAYTIAVDEEYIYTTTCLGSETIFFKYDQNLKLISKKSFQNPFVMLTNQMVPVNEFIYVLCGYHNPNGSEDKNMLIKMTKDFEILEEIDLGAATDSSLLRMAYSKNKFYMTETNSGKLSNGEPGPANRILVYDLSTEEKEFLTLTYPYPMEVYVDENNENLIIRHYELYVPNFTWTILHLPSGNETFISFPEQQERAQITYVPAPAFTQEGNSYYLLFDNQLMKVDALTKETTSFDLSSYDLEWTSAIIFK